MAKKVFLVCTQCETPNRHDARKCNGCGRELFGVGGIFKNRFARKWACEDCGELNFERNPTCINGCNEKASSPLAEMLRGKATGIKEQLIEKRNEAIIKGVEWLINKAVKRKK